MSESFGDPSDGTRPARAGTPPARAGRWAGAPAAGRAAGAPGRPAAAERRDPRRDRRVWRTAMLLSVAAHLLLFLAWPRVAPLLVGGTTAEAKSTPPGSDPIHLVRLPAPEGRPVPVASGPVVELPPPGVTRPALPRPRPSPSLTPAAGTAGSPAIPLRTSPPAATVGNDDIPAPDTHARPVARTILGDWRAPRSLHGMGITVRVHIDTVGRPTGFVELVPPTPDSVANREILHRVRQLEYAPALRNGRAVPAWAEIALVFCRSSVTATSPAPRAARLPDGCAGEP